VRRVRRILLALLLPALALTGCGAEGASGPGDRRLTVQAAGGEGELGALRELIAAYEDAHPEVEVDFVGVPNQGDHIAKLSTAFAGGSPPDVFLLNYRRLGPFVERGVLAPVQLGKLSLDEFYRPPIEAFTYDGRLACLPQNVSSSVAYLNLDLLEQAGVPLPEADWTWSDLEAAARALHGKGIAAFGFEPLVRNVAPFVWTAGGEVVDDTAEPTAMTFDSPQARQALSFLDGLQAYGVDARSRAATPPVEQFAAGELAIFVDSRRSVPAFRKADGLHFDVRPLPREDPTRPSASLLASDAYCVADASDVPELAADFALFAAGPEGGQVLARSGRTVPALRSLATGPAFLDPSKPPASSQVWLDIVDDLRRLPNVAAEDEAEEAADDLLAQFFAGNAALEPTVVEIRRATAAVYGQDR
jgi:multiple sugar transport system substrate-binding protein